MKKLNVEAAILDLRHLSEETLASYEQIGMQAALVLTGPDTETLLAKHAVELEAALVHRCDDETAVNVVNGKATCGTQAGGKNDPDRQWQAEHRC